MNNHSSEKRGLRSTFFSGETLQNLLYFWKKKTHVVFSFFIVSNFKFYLMNALVYINIDRGIHKVKLKVAHNEKRKKLHGFSFSINVANFEAFWRTKKLISNLFFLKCAKPTHNTFTYRY